MIGSKRDVSALLLVAELETAELDCVMFALEDAAAAELDVSFAELTGTVAALETIFTELDDAVELERNFDELDSFDFGLEENTSEL